MKPGRPKDIEARRRVLRILIEESESGLRFSDLAHVSGVPKSTLANILREFVEAEVLSVPPKSDRLWGADLHGAVVNVPAVLSC